MVKRERGLIRLLSRLGIKSAEEYLRLTSILRFQDGTSFVTRRE